jgi:hypothetical protein
MFDALLRASDAITAPTPPASVAEPFAPWAEELQQQAGLDGAARAVLSGPAASAMERATRPLRRTSQQVLAFDSDPQAPLDGGLREWLRSPGTLPRAQRLVRCFPAATCLLRGDFGVGREAMLERGGWLVAVGWSDDAWGSGERILAKALALVHGGQAPLLPTPATSSVFEYVAAAARRDGLRAAVARGQRRPLSPEQIWTLLAATRFAVALAALDAAAHRQARTLTLEAMRRTPPASWAASLDYLVIEKP